MSFQYSIYIPRMSTCHTVASIHHYMSYISVGDIDRIDFTPINKKPGFGEDVDSVVKSAFIHFSNPVTEVGTQGEKFWTKILSGESYKIQVSQNEYWICLKNKNPIKHTMMNIHQVVENGRYLENLVQEQAEKIHLLERKLDGVHQVLYQLLGGIYCQRNQADMIKLHHAVLHGEKFIDDICNNSKWSIWPTTRQGDECERRIEELEKICARLDTNLHDEDQDSQLLRRKYHKVEMDDDDSTINSELIGEHIIEMEDYETPDYRWRHQK